MTDDQEETDSFPPRIGALTRRMLLKGTGFVSLLSGVPGTNARTARTAEAGENVQLISPDDITTAERTTTLDSGLGQHAKAVALDGTTALIGVPPAAETIEPEAGRVAVLTRSGGKWTRQAILSPAGDSGQFGRAVALDGDTAVIGGELGPDPTGDHAGSVAVFTRTDETWTRQATLGADGSDGVDLFGTAVALDDDTVLVGASAATNSEGRSSGAAFVYERSGGTWTRGARISTTSEAIEGFGRAVALDGETAVIGARRVGGAGKTDSGVVFVFRRQGGTWRRQTRLTPVARDHDDGFGTALGISGRTVIVGAPTETNAIGINAGAVYVFARGSGQWPRQSILRNQPQTAYQQFGSALTVDENVMLVGTKAGGGPFVFVRSGVTWSQVTSLQSENGERSRADTIVALDGGRAVVAIDHGRTDPDRPTGSVEIFEP